MFWDAAPPLLRFLSSSLWHRSNKGLGLGGDPAQKYHDGVAEKPPVLLRYNASCMGTSCHGGWHPPEHREQVASESA